MTARVVPPSARSGEDGHLGAGPDLCGAEPGCPGPDSLRTHLATDLLGVPIALAVLRDPVGRLRVAGIGVEIDAGRPDEPHPLVNWLWEQAATSPAVVAQDAEPLAVPPLLAEVGASRAAVVPVLGPAGTTVGVLAVADTGTRPWSSRQRTLLAVVAELLGSDAREARLVVETTRLRAELHRMGQELRLLAEASAIIASSMHDQQELLEQLVDLAVPLLGDWCCIYLPERGMLTRVAVAHIDPARAPLVARLRGSYPIPLDDRLPAVQVYRSGQPLIVSELDEQVFADVVDPAYSRILTALGTHTALLVPLRIRGRTVGVLACCAAERQFGPAELRLVVELARRISPAVDTAGELQRERSAAAALQQSVLPEQLPTLPGIELAAGYRPATEGMNVGGDWYDAFRLPDGRVGLVVGDTAGHGIEAATVMGELRNGLRAYAAAGHSAGGTLARLDTMLAAFHPEVIATAVFALVDPDRRRVQIGSAGHPPPVLIRGRSTRLLRRSTGAPLGTGPLAGTRRPAPVESTVTLSPGDRLVLYSDGLVERRGVDLDAGFAALRTVLERSAGRDAQELCGDVLSGMLTNTHDDDVCVLAAVFSAVGAATGP